ncbi:hypothetical protein Sjap_004447 [Stephania japonica]|uniref:Uncharacterized protein n=1 Tax=Stephania japonica TaxID=461633 RepID=A0AAP0K3J5_9MAGN
MALLFMRRDVGANAKGSIGYITHQDIKSLCIAGIQNLAITFATFGSSPQTWHEFNDSRVIEVSEELALSQEAYILFYVRESSPWFATLMEDQKQSHDKLNPYSDVIACPSFYTPHEAFHTDEVSTLMEDQNSPRGVAPKQSCYCFSTFLRSI